MPKRSSQRQRLGCTFYRSDSGHEPVREWLRDLGKEVSKAVGKKTRTTPRGELDLARKRMKEVAAR